MDADKRKNQGTILRESSMKKISVMVMTLLFCLVTAGLCTAEEDAQNCKDHPLVYRMPGYFIAAGNEIPAKADLDIVRGGETETVHLEGKSTALSFMPGSDLKTKPSEAELRTQFENYVLKMNGTRLGVTYGQQWPVYTVTREGKKYWIVLMINPGQYFTGSYACRVIETT